MDREAWRAAFHGVAKSRTWLSNWTELKAFLCGAVSLAWKDWERPGSQGSSATYSLPDPGPLNSPMESHSYWIHNCTTASQHRMIKGHRTQNMWSTALFLVKVLVAQLCLTLCNPTFCNPSGSTVHGILQARTLQWVAIPFSRGSSTPRDGTQVSCTASRFFTIWATREVLIFLVSTQ